MNNPFNHNNDTIKFNHTERNIPSALGITEARTALLQQALEEAHENLNLHTITEHIEAITKALPRLTSAEYTYIGFIMGANVGSSKALHEMKANMEGMLGEILHDGDSEDHRVHFRKLMA